jgi:hypothetical protein
MKGFGRVLTLFEKTEIMNLIKYFFEVNTIFLTLMTLLSTNCVSLSTRYLSNCIIEISLWCVIVDGVYAQSGYDNTTLLY